MAAASKIMRRATNPPRVGADQEDRRRLPPQAEDPSSVATAALCRQAPKVGAACGNSACAVLCGGRMVTTVPTANEHRRSKRRCATVLEMKEGPSGSAIRSLIPSHRRLLWAKATVVSAAETLGR